MVPVRERLERSFVPEPNTGCWLWALSSTSLGYGWIKINGRSVAAHRVSYREFVGPIPDGLCVLHRCDTPACINPAHLFLGTVADNNRDAKDKGRWSFRPMPRGEACPLSRPRRGSGNPFAKLNEAQVLAARKAYASGEKVGALAKRFNLSVSGMRDVVLGLSWKDVSAIKESFDE